MEKQVKCNRGTKIQDGCKHDDCSYPKCFNKEPEDISQEDTVSPDMLEDFKNSQEFDNMQMDKAVNPKHYKDNIFGKELIEVMGDCFSHAEVVAYCKINVFKYRMRAGKKSDSIEQDIKKALWYENKAIELKEAYDNLPF